MSKSFKTVIDRFRRDPIKATAQKAEVEAQSQDSASKVSRSEGTLSFYFRFFIRDKPALVGLIIILVFFVWSVIEGTAQELAILLHNPAYSYALLPSDPVSSTINFNDQLQPPSLNHFPNLIFGTDQLGRSIFAEILYAAPHDAEAPLLVVGVAMVIGMFLGTAAGYFGGWIDEILMRLTDAFLALPILVFAIAVAVLFGSGYQDLLAALLLVWWPTYARFFRVQALTIRRRAYVESAKLSGIKSFWIILKHIIPNSIDPVIAYVTLDLGSVILLIAALAFLGVGVSFNYPEWGFISSIGLQYFPADWWWPIMPGIVIGIIVAAFTLAGDRLQDLISGRMNY